MENKAQVLMQLRDNAAGFAGITQETQLLFESFLDSSRIDAHGLIVKDGPNHLRRLPRALATHRSHRICLPHEKIKCLSDFIIRYKANTDSNQLKLSPLDALFLPFSVFALNTLSTLGCSVPLDHFEAQGFEDFLWAFFFSTTLSPDAFKKVTCSPFRTLRYPVNLMHLAGCFAFSYPKLNTQGYDIFLAQMPFPARVSKSTQLVIRYHDAIPMFAPHLIQKARFHQLFHFNALKLNAKTALFACVSEVVRNDLLTLFPRLEKRAVVIPDLVADDYYREEAPRPYSLVNIIASRIADASKGLALSLKEGGEGFPYLLMVSRIDPRKNHARLIEAWEQVRYALKDPLKLIFVGKMDGGLSFDRSMNAWQERGELFHLQQVPPSELRFLYQQAACVVCPSVMEGFDLTGVEAMLCGGKVAASNIAVHREIYGEAAVYFDPYSVDDQVAAITSLVLPEQAAWAKKMSETGVKWAKKYQRQAILPQWEQFFDRIKACEY